MIKGIVRARKPFWRWNEDDAQKMQDKKKMHCYLNKKAEQKETVDISSSREGQAWTLHEGKP